MGVGKVIGIECGWPAELDLVTGIEGLEVGTVVGLGKKGVIFLRNCLFLLVTVREPSIQSSYDEGQLQ